MESDDYVTEMDFEKTLWGLEYVCLFGGGNVMLGKLVTSGTFLKNLSVRNPHLVYYYNCYRWTGQPERERE